MGFLQNIWYMAGWSQDLGADPISRRIIDQPLVLYRSKSGKVAALADACPHRFIPLHLGQCVEADRIRCAYHGLEFDSTGACVHNPHGKGRIPPAAKVRSYPSIEKNGIIWVWMGTKAPDLSLLPDFSLLDEADPVLVSKRDWLSMPASYLFMTENLLDLSHASFLHEGVLGNEDTIKASLEVERQETSFTVRRFMADVTNPALGQLLFHGDGRRVDFWADITWQAPACLLNDSGFKDVGAPRESGTGTLGVHILTPETQTSTRYYFCAVRNNPLPLPEEKAQAVRERIGELRRVAFGDQDRPVLEAQQQAFNDPSIDTSRPALFEIDVGAAEFHRRLEKLIAAEQQSESAKQGSDDCGPEVHPTKEHA